MKLYAGDAPGNAPYGFGANPRQQMLAAHRGGSMDIGATAQGKNWLQWNQQQADNNMASMGVTPKGGGHMAASRAGMQPPQAPSTTTPSALGGGSNPFGQGFGGGFGGQNGMNINTSIQPSGIYSPQMTSRAQNQLQADAHQRANLPWLMKQFDTPGISRSEGTLGLAAPQAGNILAGGDEQAANLGLSDAVANQKQLLAGQIARGNEGYALGGLNLALQEAQDRFNQQQFGNVLSLMSILR